MGTTSSSIAALELKRMHAVYREGGRERMMAPHIVYSDATCPHHGCDQPLQAIDFCLVAHGPGVHDPPVRSWWDDQGFAGRCTRCGGWIHFTIRAKRAISADDAAMLPQLPDNWHIQAIVL